VEVQTENKLPIIALDLVGKEYLELESQIKDFDEKKKILQTRRAELLEEIRHLLQDAETAVTDNCKFHVTYKNTYAHDESTLFPLLRELGIFEEVCKTQKVCKTTVNQAILFRLMNDKDKLTDSAIDSLFACIQVVKTAESIKVESRESD
jgi:glutaredoxin 2